MDTNSIYAQMVNAGIPISNHYSDLYVEVNDKSREIIKNYEFRRSVTTFRNNVTGTQWYDIPLAYDPYWDKRMVRK